MPGEKIWFKAYIVNDTDNKPSLRSTNLHLNLYNTSKELVSSHLFLAKDGTSHRSIELDKKLDSGEYYIELTTQWNQNFNDNASITSLEIVSNTEQPSAILDTNINQDFNLDFYPESNLFLENIENTIAFTSKTT